MFSNESKQFELIVKNLANGTLTNLQIKVKTKPYCCDIEITPKKLDLLKPTNSTSFLIVISSGIKPGNYTLIFNISSDQIWKEISTRLMVKELIKEATLIDEFSNLLKKINYLYNSALNKEKEGYDVKEVIETLKNAKIACDEKDYERCLNLINKADELLKNVKKPLPIVIIFFIIIMLLALIFIKIKFNFGKIRKILLIL
jgi:flagellin-specific chaperone FliS